MPTPRPLQQFRAKQTRKRLLDAARRVFAQKSYAGATLDDVVTEAGCSKGAYYFHFASKEDALIALIDEWSAARARLLSQVVRRQAPPHVALATLFGTVLTVDADGWEPHLVMEFWSQAERNPAVAERLAAAERSRREAIAEALATAHEAGVLAADIAPRSAAELLVALERGLIARAALGERDGVEDLARTLLLLLTGRPALRKAG